MTLKVLDLFAGIGGFSLGLERTGGFQTVAFCEIDTHAQKVLKKNWPEVPIFEDVSQLTRKDIDGTIDVITGGFPCQDISLAGKGAGLDGARSGLWWEYHRIIKEFSPKYAIIENVSALRSRGLEEVLWSLTEIGYDTEWHCIPARAVGAPHQRDRLWAIAYPQRFGPQGQGRCLKSLYPTPDEFREASGLVDAFQRNALPYVCGRHDGISSPLERLKQLGNAVVPQIPELIGRAILEHLKENK